MRAGDPVSDGGSKRTPVTVSTAPVAEAAHLIFEPLRPLPTERPREPTPSTFGERPDRFVSSRTVRAMAGDASKRKIRDWVDRGEFNSYALDGKTVYSEREVLAFLERVKARGPSRAPWRGNQSQGLANTPGTPQRKTASGSGASRGHLNE